MTYVQKILLQIKKKKISPTVLSELVQINNFQYKAKFNLIAYFFENSKGLPITIRQTGRDCNTVHFRPKCQQKPSGLGLETKQGNSPVRQLTVSSPSRACHPESFHLSF